MRFSTVAVAAMAAGAQALSYTNATYVTEVVTALTTVCPSPTQITYGGQTYTVTKATTLTITNCPCTITRPVTSTPAPPPPVVSTKGSPVPPPVVTSAVVPPPYANGTTPVVPTTPVGTGKPTTTSARATFTGAANKAMAASGAGLAGLFAAVAYVL